MGLGSVLVGIAVLIVVGAYVALPFRRAEGDPDRVVETWVRQVRAGGVAPRRAEETPQRTGVAPQRTGVAPQPAEGRPRRRHRARPSSGAEAMPQYSEDEEINFCPKCGRRAGPDDYFCAGCGNKLRESAE
jgi:hypothetical protein